MSATEAASKEATTEQKKTREPRDFEADREAREFQKHNKKIYIRGLPPKHQKSDVENLCQVYGKITDIMVRSDKGFAFVTYETREAAQYAILGLTERHHLNVNWAKPSEAQKNAAKKAAADKKVTEEKDQVKEEKKEAPVAEEVKEKERFANFQRVAQPVKAAPVVAAKPVAAAPVQAKKQQAPKKPAAPTHRFKVTIQNESNGTEVVLSISYDEWERHIRPLFDNNKPVVVSRQ